MKYIIYSLLLVVLSQVGGWTSAEASYIELSPEYDIGLSGLFSAGTTTLEQRIVITDSPTTLCNSGTAYGGDLIYYGSNQLSLFTSTTTDRVTGGTDFDLVTFEAEHGDGDYVYFSANLSGCYGHAGADNTAYLFFSIIDGEFVFNTIPVEPTNTNTRIIRFYPAEDSTAATGTQAVGFDGYLNIDDWNGEPAYFSYLLIDIEPFNQTGCLLGAGDCPYVDVEQDLTTFGGFNYSTTTNLDQIGEDRHTACIYYDPITIFGFSFNYHVVCDDASFTVATGTGFLNLSNTIYDEWASGFASTTLNIANVCNILSSSFSMSNCLMGIIVPPASVIQDNLTILSQQAPWGYLFRLYDILNGSATTSTTTLPTIDYTWGTTSPFYGYDISFDPFGALASSTNILNEVNSDQVEQKSFREITEPVITLIVYLGLFFVVMNKLLKLKINDNVN